MIVVARADVELADAWIEGDPALRWSSGAGHGPSSGASASGSSLLRVDPGCQLARHTDSAEEVVVVLDGAAEVSVVDETASVAAGDAVVVPKDRPHSVRNAGEVPLWFLAVYADRDVVTRYEQPVQPGGETERSPLG
jgi:mannose-6-phosphate isomerase-like protein (cupin superfamily)